MKKIILLLLTVLFYKVELVAQTPTWTANLGNIGFDKINYIKKAGTSTVLICTNNKIFGVSAKEKKIIWEQDISNNISDSSIKIHEGTPYITIFSISENGKNNFFFKSKYKLINSETGKIIYSNEADKGKVMSETFMQQKNGILTVVKEGSSAYVSFRSLLTGDEVWRKSFSSEETKGKGLLGGIMKLAGLFIIKTEENNDKGNTVILYTYNDIYCLDAENGKEIWKKGFEKRITQAVRSNDLKYLFIQDIKNKLRYLDASNGNEVFVHPDKENSKLIGVDTSKKGYITKFDRGINILNSSGEYLFKRFIGDIKPYDVNYFEDGFIVSNYKSKARLEHEDNNMRQETGNTEGATISNHRNTGLVIAKYDFEGKKIWTKSTTDSNATYHLLNNGVMIITEESANMYSYIDGKSLWPNVVKLKGETSFGYDYDSLRIYAYSNNNVECFNLLDGSYKNITTKFKFKDKLADNDRVFITSIKQGIFLNTNQNYALLDKSGNVTYNKSLVDVTGVSKRFKNTLNNISDAIALVGFASQVSAYARMGDYNTASVEEWEKYKVRMGKAQKIYNVSTDINGVVKTLNSFGKESVKSENTITILSNDGKPCAVVIDKATGTEKRRVRILDVNPIMYVDDTSNTLYIITSLLELKTYSLN